MIVGKAEPQDVWRVPEHLYWQYVENADGKMEIRYLSGEVVTVPAEVSGDVEMKNGSCFSKAFLQKGMIKVTVMDLLKLAENADVAKEIEPPHFVKEVKDDGDDGPETPEKVAKTENAAKVKQEVKPAPPAGSGKPLL